MADVKISSALKSLVIKRASGYCEYCKSPAAFSPGSFEFDHIVPLSLGGDTFSENLAYACGGCNGHKYNKIQFTDPLTLQLAPLFNPRLQRWNDEFDWSNDDLAILGTTSSGRATVDLLQLNRTGNINLRGLLKSAGLHPPLT